MSEDEQQIETRELIEDIVKDEPAEPVQEARIEDEVKPVKTTAKANAKPKIKITKEPVEPVEPIKEEEPAPVVGEKTPKKLDKLKGLVSCPDCNLSMTVHTLNCIHKKNTLFLVEQFTRKNKKQHQLKNHLDYKSKAQ